MQVQISRRTLILGVAVVLAVVAVAAFFSLRTSARATAASTSFSTPTPMSAEGWSRLFLSGPGERTIGDGSTVLTGRATWIRRGEGGDEIHLRTKEGVSHDLVVPDGAYVYRADAFFSAAYPQPTVENRWGVLAGLKDTPVMVRIRDGRVTTVFVLLEVEQ